MTQDPSVSHDGTILMERQAHLSLTVHRFVAEIEEVIQSVKKGDFGELKALPKLQRELLSTSKQLRDSEIQLDQQLRKASGETTNLAFDFNDARDTIGGKLDRLRSARSAGGISQEFDAE